MSRATDKQVRYLMVLLGRAGYPTEWMCSRHKALGASMRERQGRVEDWLRGMSIARASGLIEHLLQITGGKK